MIRLHIIAEGQTEESFIKNIVAPYLAEYNVFIDARCVLTSKDRRSSKVYRGGMTSYKKARNDILAWMKQDKSPECRFSTMFDLYALPNDFPGFLEAQKLDDPYSRVEMLERAVKDDIGKEEGLNSEQFIPYIQLHEFETLIFSRPEALSIEYMEHDDPIANLVEIIESMKDKNPELINGGNSTAPSKRILKEIPEYDKVGSGVLVLKEIGLDFLRDKCQHFNSWLTILEKLS